MKYKAIMFDWDGCLADTLSVWLDTYKKTFDDFGLSISDRIIIERAIGNFEAANEFGIDDEVLFANKLIDYSNSLMTDLKLNGDIEKVMKGVKKKGLSVAVVTSSVRASVLPFLDKYGLSSYVDVLIAGDEVEYHKPHPEPIHKALNYLKLEAGGTMMVGDHLRDIEASRSAGARSALYYPEHNIRFYGDGMEKKWKADVVFDDWEKFLEIVE